MIDPSLFDKFIYHIRARPKMKPHPLEKGVKDFLTTKYDKLEYMIAWLREWVKKYQNMPDLVQERPFKAHSVYASIFCIALWSTFISSFMSMKTNANTSALQCNAENTCLNGMWQLDLVFDWQLTDINDHVLPYVEELDNNWLRFSDDDLGFDFVRPVFKSASPFTHVESWIQTSDNQSTLIRVFLCWTIWK